MGKNKIWIIIIIIIIISINCGDYKNRCNVSGQLLIDNKPANNIGVQFIFQDYRNKIIHITTKTSKTGKFSFYINKGKYLLTGKYYKFSNNDYITEKHIELYYLNNIYDFNTNTYKLPDIKFNKKLKLIFPIKVSVDKANIEFNWNKFNGAQYYRFRIIKIISNQNGLNNVNAELYGSAENIEATNLLYNDLLKGNRKAKPLTKGKYVWQLQAIGHNKEVVSYSSDNLEDDIFYVK